MGHQTDILEYMEKLPANEFLKNLDSALNEKIANAKQHLIHEKEYEEYLALEERASSSGLRENDFNRLNLLKRKVTGSTITVKTLPEYRRAMELLGYNHDDLIDTLAHENAHANTAERLGARHDGYNLLLKKAEAGIHILPQAFIYIPDEWDTKKQIEVHEKIVRAPEEYGNTLSPGDIKDLSKLKKN